MKFSNEGLEKSLPETEPSIADVADVVDIVDTETDTNTTPPPLHPPTQALTPPVLMKTLGCVPKISGRGRERESTQLEMMIKNALWIISNEEDNNKPVKTT